MMVDVGRKPCPVPPNTFPSTPPGLEALYLACRSVYPDQPNPLQVSALVKYWLGGPDPLDYISMYYNPGNVDLGVPPHWHYISFGFSDLHGDGRVHPERNNDDLSGFGFELTFRLKREASEVSPPTWPAQLLQSLAKYVFNSDNMLKAGDHVSWHKALDFSESMIEHMLLIEDPQLGTVHTPNGTVSMIQIVGVTKAELEATQQWSPQGVLEILKKIPGGAGGGEWLVTDMRRGMSLFELEPNAAQLVKEGIEKDGSNLSGVTSYCYWRESREKMSDKLDDVQTSPIHSPEVFSHGECVPWLAEELQSPELLQSRTIEKVDLIFNHESGSLLSLAIRGRVKHGRHFTFKAVTGDYIITFVGEGVSGTNVDLERPYAAMGSWLQVLIPDSFVEELALQIDSEIPSINKELPKSYSWPERGLNISILPELTHVKTESKLQG